MFVESTKSLPLSLDIYFCRLIQKIHKITMPKSVKEIGIVLLLISLAFIILLSSSSRLNTGFFSDALSAALKPFYNTVFFLRKHVVSIFDSYVMLVSVKGQNDDLRRENARLRMENSGLLESVAENQRLRKFMGLKSSLENPSLVAQVIGLDATGIYRTVFINRGRDDGINSNMPVVVADGVVGKVVRASSNMAQVALLTDPMLSIDARVDTTRDRGVVTGSPNNTCVMKYISRKAAVRNGDKVMTSGLDGVFPKGLSIGVIESVQPGPQGLFLEAQVQPTADLNELEEVLVILVKQGGFHVEPLTDGTK